MESSGYKLVCCVIVLSILERQVHSTGGTLLCKIFTTSLPLTRPVITKDPGNSLTLECRVICGGPVDWITWTRDGQVIDKTPGQSKLLLPRLKNITTADAGVYECSVGAGSARDYSLVVLKVNEPPVITSKRGSVPVRMGSQLRLPCKATGKPPPSISWHMQKGGKITVLRNGSLDGRVSLRQDKSALLLVIQRMSAADQGTYECHARNTLGTTSHSVFVPVHNGQPSITPTRRHITAHTNGNVSLTCEGQNLRRITTYVYWKFNGKYIDYRDKRFNLKISYRKVDRVHTMQTVLSKAGVGEMDSGTYTCGATHFSGTVEADVDLRVEDSNKVRAGRCL